MINVPVLYIIFNRLDTVKQSFEAIRAAQPSRLYLAADGPRKDRTGEAERCEEVRNWVLSRIDWNCELHQRFQETNVGCGHHPADAISWLFENEESGIILEDDCVASPSFFPFVAEMLQKYKDDKDVSIVCGSNFDKEHRFQAKEADYFFSKISYTWGWATWKRNWMDYDYTMQVWNTTNKSRLLKWLFDEPEYREYWRYVFDSTVRTQPQDIWDYQFFFSCYRKRQMSIVPNVNLISNIGDGVDATHVMKSEGRLGNEINELEFPLDHPDKKVRNEAYDSLLQEVCYGRAQVVPFHTRLKRQVKKLIRKH